MRKIIDRFINFLKLKFKSKKIESSVVTEPKVNRLTYTKRADN